MFQKINLLFIFVVCILPVVYAQTFEEDMKQITERLKDNPAVSIKVKIDIYTKKGGTRIQQLSSSIQRKGDASLHILGDQETFNSPAYAVSVDHEEKLIIIHKKGKQEGLPDLKLRNEELKQLEALLKSEGKKKEEQLRRIIKTADQGGIRTYVITGTEGYKEVSVSLDMNRKAIRKITYEYEAESGITGQYMVLDYTDFKVGTEVSAQLSVSRYFTIVNKTYLLTPLYKGYQLSTDL